MHLDLGNVLSSVADTQLVIQFFITRTDAVVLKSLSVKCMILLSLFSVKCIFLQQAYIAGANGKDCPYLNHSLDTFNL